MSRVHVVKPGETLSSIAQKHGFQSWRDLYYYKGNEEFRSKRLRPDKIFAGDKIIIPPKTFRAPNRPPTIEEIIRHLRVLDGLIAENKATYRAMLDRFRRTPTRLVPRGFEAEMQYYKGEVARLERGHRYWKRILDDRLAFLQMQNSNAPLNKYEQPLPHNSALAGTLDRYPPPEDLGPVPEIPDRHYDPAPYSVNPDGSIEEGKIERRYVDPKDVERRRLEEGKLVDRLQLAENDYQAMLLNYTSKYYYWVQRKLAAERAAIPFTEAPPSRPNPPNLRYRAYDNKYPL